MGEDAVVEHVRRRQQDGRLALADGLLLGLGLSPGVLGDRDARGEAQPLRQVGERLGLVVDERDLRGDVEGGRAPVECPLEGRNRVRQALPAGRLRREDDVLPVSNGLDGGRLVGVALRDALVLEDALESRVEVDVGEPGVAAGNGPLVDDLALVVRSGPEPRDGVVHGRATGRNSIGLAVSGRGDRASRVVTRTTSRSQSAA